MVIVLLPKKEKVEINPNLPDLIFPKDAPNDSAASSIRYKPYLLHKSINLVISGKYP